MNSIIPNAYSESDFISEGSEPATLESVLRDVSNAMSQATGVSVENLTRPIPLEGEADRDGQPITTDLVFDLFAGLVPDSPWASRLLKIRDLFNAMGSAITELQENPCFDLGDYVEDVKDREGLGWTGPSVTSFSHVVSKFIELHMALNPVRKDVGA